MVEDATAMFAKGRTRALPAHVFEGVLLEAQSLGSLGRGQQYVSGTHRVSPWAKGIREKIRESDVGRECDTAARRNDTLLEKGAVGPVAQVLPARQQMAHALLQGGAGTVPGRAGSVRPVN